MVVDTPPKHLHSLDALRGVAALAVVVWHWQHFFFVDSQLPSGFDRGDQPLFALLRLFYTGGGLAVDLFFSISGFVFFWLYAQSVRSGAVSAREFFVLRASRLYPLHVLTLLVVVLAQAVFRSLGHADFVYGHNDPYHFVLNLFFLQSVGMEQGYSFNGPTWSVSVEVVLYALFFLLCRWPRPLLLVGLSLFGFFVVQSVYPPLGEGVGSFFLGGCVFLLYRRILQSAHAPSIARAVCVLALALWATVIVSMYWDVSWRSVPGLGRIATRFPQGILFPVTILALALGETYGAWAWKRLSMLGDISYSSYLWHFPLQMAFMLAGLSHQAFTSPVTLLVFFAILLPLSLASHRLFEMPVQRAIRHRLLGQRRKAGDATDPKPSPVQP